MFGQWPYEQETIKYYGNSLVKDLKDQLLDWSENKNTVNEFRYVFESNFVGADRLFVLVYSNQDGGLKQFKGKKYYL